MHILFVTNYFEPDSGAAAIRLTRLAKLLQQRGHQITVLTSLPHYPQGKIHEGYRRKAVVIENRDGIRVIQTWLSATSSPRISRKLFSQISFMLTAALRGLVIPRPDVVLIEAQPVFTLLAGVFLAMVKRVPFVLNISDLWPDHLLSVRALSEKSLIYRLARWLVDFTYRRASGIIAMSPGWADIIKGYISDHEKISVIYNGVDLQQFHPDINPAPFREKYGLEAPYLVSFIGTFATQYDFEQMFKVAHHFQDRKDVCFVLMGQGSQEYLVEQQLADQSKSNMTWLKWVDSAEMPAAWNASTLTFWVMQDHALYRGTIPAKLYEAFACGTPIAAISEGVAAHMIQESGAGIVCSYGDVAGLIAAVQRLLDDAEFRQQCSQSARQYAEQHFDPEKVAIAYEAVLLNAAKP